MRIHPVPLIACLLCLSIAVGAQDSTRYALRLNSGSFIPPRNINSDLQGKLSGTSDKSGGKSLVIIQFNERPAPALIAELKQQGIALLDYVPDFAYTATISGEINPARLQQQGVRSVITLSATQKMQPILAAGNFPARSLKQAGAVDVWISFPSSFTATEVINILKGRNFDILSEDLKSYRILAVRVPVLRLGELALLSCVEYLQAPPGEDEPLSAFWTNWGRDGLRVSQLNAPISQGGKNLKGSGVVIGIGDSGDPQSHVDFTGRLIPRAAAPYFDFPYDHGTHVSGIAAGGGIVNEIRTGYAPKAQIVSQVFSGIYLNAPTYVSEYGMVLTNNSYGNIVNDCTNFGLYDLLSRTLDQQAYDLPELQHMFSAGNSGWSVCAPYPDSFRTVLGMHQSAKNVLTVGNAKPSDMEIFSRSSRGPARDGRLKPEITGIGSFITSTGPYITYYYENTGTSMSSPAIAGGMALLVEKYRLLHAGANPKNGLLKALVCNSGDDWGRPGPDYSFGYGIANFWRANQVLENNQYSTGTIAPGPAQTININVPAGTAELKVMLYWNDPAAAAVVSQTLVNNLDLQVITPSAATVLPFVLDTTAVNVKNPAVTGVDNINNIEQVVIKNPAAGAYTIRIIPTAINVNPSQEYHVVYDFVPTETRMVTPMGGETYQQGENVVARWDAYGTPENEFTLEFSSDNGASWTVLKNNISANRRHYFYTTPTPNEWWIVPAVTTDQALMRVTRNGTGQVSTSLPFVIHDTLFTSLAANQCEGYMTINWTAVTGATGYEVMMLQGTEMVTIATVSSGTLSYTVGGLNKDSVYWMTARPLIGTSNSPGRRGVAVSRQPNGGSCTGPLSFNDGDIKIDAILSPLRSGRLLTSTALTNSEPVSIRIKNLDDAATTGNILVSYQVNAGPVVSEVITNPGIAAGATYVHNFAGANNLDLSAAGTYSIVFTATPQAVSDPFPVNNSLTQVFKQLPNSLITGIDYPASPYLDNFDLVPEQTFTKDQIGLTGLDRYDFVNSNDTGRIRSFINGGIARSGNRALTMDAWMYYQPGVNDSLTATFNLSGYDAATDEIRMDFWYKNHRQINVATNRVWIRGDDTKDWVEVYNLYDNQNPSTSSYKFTGSIELSDLLRNATPTPQNFSTSFQVRWGTFAQMMTADNFSGAGYTFDDIRIYKVTDDMAMLSIDTPYVNNCGLNATTPIRVAVRNTRSTDVNTVPVRYRVNGGAWITENVPLIPADDTVQYTFSATADLSAAGDYLIETQVIYATDSYDVNDTTSIRLKNVLQYTVTNTTPYLQDFESGDGSWYVLEATSSWEYGTPASYKIKRAASGTKAWKTKLAGNYRDYEYGFLYSPCFNVSTVTNPTLSFSLALDIEDCGASVCDGAYVEYSLDGKNWTRLGANGQGTNWYNKNYVSNNMWSAQNYDRWHVATIPLSVIPVPVAQMTQIRFRFGMFSDPEVNREGMAVDDIHIYSNPYGIYDQTGTSPLVNQAAVSGTGWIDFVESGTSKLIASVNPNGQNMGSTDVQSYVFTGPVRTNSLQYYHNRNITIKPATVSLADSATVRFYFLDTETETLINATGCGTCTKPAMAYELGVTKYSDPNDNNEDGTLANNSGGIYSFIIPSKTRMVPFDKGYYAEFKVKEFSEFWLNNGWLNGVTPLPLKLIAFTARKQNSRDVLLEWTTAEELEVDRFEVEMANGNTAFASSQFSRIGTVFSAGNSMGEQRYQLLDIEPGKSGIRYYRLKMIDKDGSIRYSAVRPVVFSDEVKWQLYPNPTNGLISLVIQGNDGETASIKIYDASGRVIKQQTQATTGFVQKIWIDLGEKNIPSGLYLMEVAVNDRTEVFRVIRQ